MIQLNSEASRQVCELLVKNMLTRKVGTCRQASFFSIPVELKKLKSNIQICVINKIDNHNQIKVIMTTSHGGSYLQRRHNTQKSNPLEQQMQFGTHYTCNAITKMSTISIEWAGPYRIKQQTNNIYVITHLYKYLIPRSDCNVWPKIS